MVVVKLYGGLGNQMFQYAAARSFAKKTQSAVGYDQEYFIFPEKFGSQWAYQLDLLKTNAKLWTPSIPPGLFYFFYRILRRLNSIGISFKKFYFEKPFRFNTDTDQIGADTFIDGYFQFEKYFHHDRAELLKEFQPRTELDEKNKSVIAQIQNVAAVSLHIRRGDYVFNQAAAQFHGTCNLDYYQRAMSMIENQVKDPVFYIFSDDLNWVKENLKLKSPAVYVEHNKGMNSYLDMFLMSHCQHNIIANSSFSWWGAWLNTNSKKIVIAPARWYLDPKVVNDDIYPAGWIKL